VVVPGRALQPIVIFSYKAMQLALGGNTWQTLTIVKNIRLGGKGLPRTNALAYLTCSLVTKRKKSYIIDN
jgi:hypothetical protein